MNLISTTDRPAFSHTDVLTLLHADNKTYEQVSQITGFSRGKIYSIAMANGARKTERLIRERHEERRKRQEETFRALYGTTAKADVLDFLPSLPSESIDLFLFSPPYNIGVQYGNAGNADSADYVEFQGRLMIIIAQMKRALKPNGIIFMQVGQTRDNHGQLVPMDTFLDPRLREVGLEYQSRIVWLMPHGLTPKTRLAERYETALVFAKSNTPTFNATPARIPQKNPAKRAFKGPNKGQLSGHPLGAHPTNVWEIPTVRHNHPDRRHSDHPAQFPTALAKRAILLYSRPGDTICDPFSGSGTTHVAAVQTGRNFIGCDILYEDIREKRLAETKIDEFTPLPGVTDESISVWRAETQIVATPKIRDQYSLNIK